MTQEATKKQERKTWKQAWKQARDDWAEAWDFDRRGMLLSFILLFAGTCLAVLWQNIELRFTAGQEFVFFLAFPLTLLALLSMDRVLRYRFSKRVGLTFTDTGAFISALAVAFGGAFAGTASAFVSIFAFSTIYLILEYFNRRAFRSYQRVQEFQDEKVEYQQHQEWSEQRLACNRLLHSLQQQKTSLTLGLAGRRGLGKTSLLRALFPEDSEAPNLSTDNDLNNREKRLAARIRHVTLFVPTPTEFAEKTFLMAILERLAQSCNEALSRLLPAVKPFRVEQELREKRRLLRYSHAMIVLLTLSAIVLNVYLLDRTGRAPVLKQIFFNADTSAVQPEPSSKLFTVMRDSLQVELRQQVAPLWGALARIDTLLNPFPGKQSWNLKGEYGFFNRQFLVQATWDSLKKVTSWPELDSLRNTYAQYQAILDSIAQVETRYRTMDSSLAAMTTLGSVSKDDSTTYSGWFWFGLNMVFIPLMVLVYYFTREGEQRFGSSSYDHVRNEIALYERTNALLERLHFQMSFGESRESGLGLKASGLGIARKWSRKIQREMRPYTTMSLIDEFRNYVADIKMYLKSALKHDEPDTDERPRIIIAIDELDKILDTDRLHDMLKSMKAIFEIENVYYFLSISEDALETYRLRHVDTKNEIDSAFTHIIPVPPMDARGSVAFFIEHHSGWSPALLPAAIVFGGGVPRDMHRISQILGTYPEKTTLAQCLDKLAAEDVEASRDMLLLHQHLSDEGKQFWLDILTRSRFANGGRVAELLLDMQEHTHAKFEEMNPCSGDVAHEQLHRLRTLLRGMVVKGYIYHRIQQMQMPDFFESWPASSEIEFVLNSIENDPAKREQLAELEKLRQAIFDLSRNPLMVWQELQS